MKISKRRLKGIIKEEIDRLLHEQAVAVGMPIVQVVDWSNEYDQTRYIADVDGKEVEVWTSGTADIEWLIENLTMEILDDLYPDVEDHEYEMPQEWSEMQAHVSESVKSNSELMRAIPELEQAISDYAAGDQGRTPRHGF